jgi:hypothetical protein
MMAFESDSEAWFEEHFSPRRAGVGILTLAASAILHTAKSIYHWQFVACGEACL